MAHHDLHAVFGDHHFPYHDTFCVNESLRVVRRDQPGTIHLLGDVADCYAVSRHRRDPARVLKFQDEIDQTRDYLKRLRKAAPRARIVYLAGNHEDRLIKFLCDKAPELKNLRALTLGSLLGLALLNIEWIESSAPYQIGDWWFTHGDAVRKHAAYTARAKMEQVGANVIIGHTHRMGLSCATTWTGTTVGIENGCLCSLDCEYVQGTPNWQQGFHLLHWDRKAKTFRPEPCLIRKGSDKCSA